MATVAKSLEAGWGDDQKRQEVAQLDQEWCDRIAPQHQLSA
ncbi:MAG: hypothetical protein ACFB2W_10070 [Leptolyngbyaceae cyanobacterium]